MSDAINPSLDTTDEPLVNRLIHHRPESSGHIVCGAISPRFFVVSADSLDREDLREDVEACPRCFSTSDVQRLRRARERSALLRRG